MIPLIIYPFGIYACLTILVAYLTFAPPTVKESEFFVQSFGHWAYLQFKPNRIFCFCYFLSVRLYLSLIVGLVPSDYDYFLLLIAVGLFADLLGCLYFTPFVSQTWNRVKFLSSVVVLFVFINAIVATFPLVQSTDAPIVVYLILNIGIVVYFLRSIRQEQINRAKKVATSPGNIATSPFGPWTSGNLKGHHAKDFRSQNLPIVVHPHAHPAVEISDYPRPTSPPFARGSNPDEHTPLQSEPPFPQFAEDSTSLHESPNPSATPKPPTLPLVVFHR